MDKEAFVDRLAQLRLRKGASAREMSLSIGQSPGYINNIENGVNLPSMSVFFYICEYLNITPMEFFDTDTPNPEKLENLIKNLKQLDDTQLETISTLVDGLLRKH